MVINYINPPFTFLPLSLNTLAIKAYDTYQLFAIDHLTATAIWSAN